MSLDPRDSQIRGRSKSPGRERSRSRSGYEVEGLNAPTPPGFDYDESRTGRNRYRDSSPNPTAGFGASRFGGTTGAGIPDTLKIDEVRYTERDRDNERLHTPAQFDNLTYGEGYIPGTPAKINVYGSREPSPAAVPRSAAGYGKDAHTPTYSTFSDRLASPREHDLSVDSRRLEESHGRQRSASFNVAAGVGKHHGSLSGGVSIAHDHSYAQSSTGSQVSDLSSPGPPGARYGTPASPVAGGGWVSAGYGKREDEHSRYTDPAAYKYAQPGDKITFSSTTRKTVIGGDGHARRDSSPPRHIRHESASARSSSSRIVSESFVSSRRDASPNPARLGDRLNTLSINTSGHLGHSSHGSLSLSPGGHSHSGSLSLANAPPSPLLESYKGTYQSISPMPSPMLMVTSHSDISETFSPLSPSGEDRSFRRTARFHDAQDEAEMLRDALKGENRAPDVHPLITILPGLTHEQILDLRTEYKKIVKTGHERKGVNIAKHIKLRLKDEDPSLMKACYAVALGQWESEAYWANFWYQGEKSRRELLIESLMGRSNREIQKIKDGFSDKKYRDSLRQCMEKELKEDKFKKAVLLVLDEKRMEESRRIDGDLLREDIRQLEKCVTSEKGGETRMIEIVCLRSDNHLREVLRGYEEKFGRNFAREMLGKSTNLVGELLAHILNGIINKPVRDALLVHHALTLSTRDPLRTELLISRLVRYHWDRKHLEEVKREYRDRYGIEMQDDVVKGVRGDVGKFLEGLCLWRERDRVREV
ncbi:6dbff52a-dbf0-40ac-be83-2c0013d21af8 [Sclerotinia trifoliorum]|uniref:6dbff52a-dbf0-40ac-be83-2c0013d21af8 n=1 Tax=Sclerotinia trifoliorum TaxID=28548 RepID=A0A8H2VWE2_9HELO|nr:6dbff52a-dbf0-40ac-be83-2c0013d21af8 [Sclerotinia trifoliorum]